MDAVYDIYTKQRVEGSVIKIESSGAGFTVQGWAFEAAAVEKAENVADLASCGRFWGNGRHWNANGFVYAYEGQKGVEQRDAGAVVYEFTSGGGQKLTVSGVFFGFGLQGAFYLQGKRIDTNTKILSTDLRREKLLLRDFLLREQPAQLP